MPQTSNAFKPLLVIFLVLVVFAGFSFYRSLNRPPEIVSWRTDFAAAQREAETEGKPLLLYFTADWCGPCQQMKGTTWADPQVEQALRAVVPIRIDIDQHPDLAMQYAVQSIPRLILLTDGARPRIHEGYIAPARMLDWLAEPAIPLPATQPFEAAAGAASR